jgi:predicted Zn-dependent protease
VSLLDQLDQALKNAEGEIELSAVSSHQGSTRFANSRVTQSGEVKDLVLQARVAIGKRVGAARTNSLAHINDAIARARELAAAQPEAPFDGFADGKPAPPVPPSWNETIAHADAGLRASWISPFFTLARKRDLLAAGLALTSTSEVAVATSAGARRNWRSTHARVDFIASQAEAAARLGGFAVGPIDSASLAERVCERAERTRNPVELEPAAFDVILEPPAVAEVLEWLSLTAFGARTVQDGSSCLAGREGQSITGPVTLVDDALSGIDGCPTEPFDSEGTPKQRHVFIDNGVARGPVHDLLSAARASASSTGHASSIGDELSEGGPSAMHLQLAAGEDSLDDLVARVDRGLYVSHFHYVNGLLDTRRALMTGMTRNGLFLIEGGRISKPVRNLRWTESLLDAFSRIGGITRNRELCTSGLSEAITVAPSLLIRGWRFTGKSR